MTTITNEQLEAVTGGVDVAAAHDKGKRWGDFVDPTGRGFTGPFVARPIAYGLGFAKGVYDTWRDGPSLQ